MKIRPLPDIDLARIAPLALAQQRKALEQIRYSHPPFSYGPLRGCLLDIFNVQPEMFGPVGRTSWNVIEGVLGKRCRSPEERKANLQVAKGLHHYATGSRILGRSQEFFPLGMSVGRKVAYWLPMVLIIDGRPLVPFIDPRRSRGLTAEGRRFAFSMMHERIRAADPDFASVRFGIIQFGDVEGDQRSPRFHTDGGVKLFSFDEMEAMVSATYDLWREVCEEREMETRREASGARGPLI